MTAWRLVIIIASKVLVCTRSMNQAHQFAENVKSSVVNMTDGNLPLFMSAFKVIAIHTVGQKSKLMW